ncbi:LOW QUALITY PROTEIN: methyltransferase-like protein 25B [Anas platyrhynchos]|uniref:LOW QUALITY PROTEIN: methyltransferase-like protein 25B n=1 Tax=Anas platyrhynchos TaxID=8839 RepID=UPI003AF27C09
MMSPPQGDVRPQQAMSQPGSDVTPPGMMSEAGSDVTAPEMTSRPPPALQREQRRAADIVRLLGMYHPLLDACFIVRNGPEPHPETSPKPDPDPNPDPTPDPNTNPNPNPNPNHARGPGGSRAGAWPLSLLAFVAAARALAFPGVSRRPRPCRPRLHPLLRRHVKAKKQHDEIRVLGHELSEATGCDRVVDVGSGQGHLSRFLAFGLGLYVAAVEGDGRLAALAERFDRELLELAKAGAGRGGGSLPTPPRHPKSAPKSRTPGSPPKKNPAPLWPRCPAARGRPLGSGAPGEEFLLPPTPGQGPPVRNPLREPGGGQRVLLTGLHACGDLSVALLRHFARSPHVAAVTSAACCYMKLSTRPQPQNPVPSPKIPLPCPKSGSQPQNPVPSPKIPLPCPKIWVLSPKILVPCQSGKKQNIDTKNAAKP